ncbi:MAG: hypothetical protein HOQ36_06395 [Nocardia sp.]|nr:hypothetical protein [Nocardia sp.]
MSTNDIHADTVLRATGNRLRRPPGRRLMRRRGVISWAWSVESTPSPARRRMIGFALATMSEAAEVLYRNILQLDKCECFSESCCSVIAR